jgi:hypothetical protein
MQSLAHFSLFFVYEFGYLWNISFGAGNPLFFNEVQQAIFGLPCIWHGLISELMNSSSHPIQS